jgi:long-subunit acyl-CoA synthetase (AMP-forming)
MDSEGRVFLLGRYKDLIISGGENISPLKVERVLDACKGVQKVSCTITQSFAATDTPNRHMSSDCQTRSKARSSQLSSRGKSKQRSVVLSYRTL